MPQIVDKIVFLPAETQPQPAAPTNAEVAPADQWQPVEINPYNEEIKPLEALHAPGVLGRASEADIRQQNPKSHVPIIPGPHQHKTWPATIDGQAVIGSLKAQLDAESGPKHGLQNTIRTILRDLERIGAAHGTRSQEYNARLRDAQQIAAYALRDPQEVSDHAVRGR